MNANRQAGVADKKTFFCALEWCKNGFDLSISRIESLVGSIGQMASELGVSNLSLCPFFQTLMCWTALGRVDEVNIRHFCAGKCFWLEGWWVCVLRQSELGLGKNFQTQSIAEKSEFINREQRWWGLCKHSGLTSWQAWECQCFLWVSSQFW